jgi:hypothetical protein
MTTYATLLLHFPTADDLAEGRRYGLLSLRDAELDGHELTDLNFSYVGSIHQSATPEARKALIVQFTERRQTSVGYVLTEAEYAQYMACH